MTSHLPVSVARYIDALIYGLKSLKLDPKKEVSQKRHWYHQMIYEDVDSALLRLFECFMEAAPQLTLQLYIMQTNGMEDGIILGETLQEPVRSDPHTNLYGLINMRNALITYRMYFGWRVHRPTEAACLIRARNTPDNASNNHRTYVSLASFRRY